MVMLPVKLLPFSSSMWNALLHGVPPVVLAHDTRKLKLYFVADATVTVYFSHSPVAVQPTL
jgi:hypothetical protein